MDIDFGKYASFQKMPIYCSQFYNSFRNKIEDSGFEFINAGSFRLVYKRKNIVLKIPRCQDGVIDNIMEAKAWKVYRDNPTSLDIHLAPCRLLDNNCLIMKFVTRPAALLPMWADNVDFRQVGFYNGKPVAYDYALNLTERIAW